MFVTEFRVGMQLEIETQPLRCLSYPYQIVLLWSAKTFKLGVYDALIAFRCTLNSPTFCSCCQQHATQHAVRLAIHHVPQTTGEADNTQSTSRSTRLACGCDVWQAGLRNTAMAHLDAGLRCLSPRILLVFGRRIRRKL